MATFIRPRATVICAKVGDDAILYDDQGGTYFGLNSVGSRTWELAGQGLSLDAIQAVIEKEFDVEPERLANDLDKLATEMAARGLWDVELSPLE